jgi:hypothetical protein
MELALFPAIPNLVGERPFEKGVFLRHPMARLCRVSRSGKVTRWRVEPRKQDRRPPLPGRFAALGELRGVPRLFALRRLAAFSDEEIVQLLAGLDRSGEPSRPQAATGPRLRGIFRIAIFRRDRSTTAASSSFASAMPIKARQLRKLALEFMSPT